MLPDQARLLAEMVLKAGDGTRGIATSVFDFGGQDVFCLLHPLFLTPYAVYMVCFNLADLLDPSTPRGRKSLDELEYWLGSIVVHARTKADATPPSIVLVGTHYDSPGLTPTKLVEINDAIYRLLDRAVFDLVQLALIRRPGVGNVSPVSLSRSVNHSHI